MAASVNEIARGNKIQSVSIESSSQFASSLSAKSQEMYANTTNILTSMEEMNEKSRESLAVVSGLNESNVKNQSAIVQIEKAISDLQEKHNDIGKIVEQMNEISSQINLLSLNAAIESARAGEAGKGFAVVAAEIRKLAEHSRKSSEDIESIISTVQKNSNGTVQAMQIVKERAMEQTEAVLKVIGAFQQISASIAKINGQLATNSEYMNQLTRDAEQLAAEIEETSAISEESAASSEQASHSLQAQAKDLDTVVSAIDNLKQLVSSLNELNMKFKVEG